MLQLAPWCRDRATREDENRGVEEDIVRGMWRTFLVSHVEAGMCRMVMHCDRLDLRSNSL